MWILFEEEDLRNWHLIRFCNFFIGQIRISRTKECTVIWIIERCPKIYLKKYTFWSVKVFFLQNKQEFTYRITTNFGGVFYHCEFLENWNTQKSVWRIWQHFSCLLDEAIPKIWKKLNLMVAFWGQTKAGQKCAARWAELAMLFCR